MPLFTKDGEDTQYNIDSFLIDRSNDTITGRGTDETGEAFEIAG